MKPEDAKRLSKFLSLVLRHEPAAAGVTLDAEGWIDIDTLLKGATQKGMTFTRSDLDHVVATSEKKRFTVSADGASIRAAQGHSVKVDLSLVPECPPELLYHGTAERNVASIVVEGLRPGSRQYVHLSSDEATARAVGARHGRPVVFRVDAAQAHADGHHFYRAENGVWLTDPLAARYLILGPDR